MRCACTWERPSLRPLRCRPRRYPPPHPGLRPLRCRPRRDTPTAMVPDTLATSHMYTCTCTMQQQEGLCGQDFASAMRLQLTGHSMLTHHHQSQAAALETVDRHALRMHKGTSMSEAAALQSKALPATSPRSEAAALQTTARCTFCNVSRHAASHMHTCTCTMHQQGLCGQDFANAMRLQLTGHSMLVRLVQPPHRGAPRKQQPHPG